MLGETERCWERPRDAGKDREMLQVTECRRGIETVKEERSNRYWRDGL